MNYTIELDGMLQDVWILSPAEAARKPWPTTAEGSRRPGASTPPRRPGPSHERASGVTKKVFIRTFGCQMNEYDSDKMADVLRAAEGYEPTNDVEQADLILFNTCSVREKAQEKVFSDLGRVKHLKAKGVLIGVGGCVASQEGAAHHRARALRRPGVRPADAAPPAADDRAARSAQRRPQVDISFPEIEKFDHLPPARVDGATRLRLDHGRLLQVLLATAWCPTPAARRCSRPFDDVLAEVAGLAEQGVKEVTLLGQNVNAYRGAHGRAPARSPTSRC